MDTTLPHLRVVVVYRRPRPPEFSTGSANSNGSSKPEEKEWTPEEDATLLQLFMSNPLGPDCAFSSKTLHLILTIFARGCDSQEVETQCFRLL